VRIRMNSIVTFAAVFAIVTATLLAVGQGAPQAPAGQQPAAGAAGAGRGGAGGRGGGGGRGAGAPAVPAGPVPRLSNGKPDLSGHWTNPYTPDMAAGMSVVDPQTKMPLVFPRKGEALPDAKPSATGRGARTYDLPYTAWGLKQWKEYDPVHNGDYAGTCMPFGMSRSVNSPHGVQLVHSNDALAMLWEQNTWFHFVPIAPNPLKWPADLPEAWNGYSTGKWDGDTLIIETKNFNGYTKLDTAGHPHSKQVVFTNTFLRTDSQTIQHTVTVHDPQTFTMDWMNVRTWRLKAPTDVIMEYSCEENNGGINDGSITPWKRPTDEELSGK